MAQIVITDQQAIAESWAVWVRTIILGAIAGVSFWLLAFVVGRYSIEPLACRQTINAAMCLDATPLAGNIAAILVAVIGTIAMVRLGIARPIIVAVATAALLWGLSGWTEGLFWLEALAWSTILYALVFALFAWITRYSVLWVTLIISLSIIVVIRITLVI